jgi:biotin synthase
VRAGARQTVDGVRVGGTLAELMARLGLDERLLDRQALWGEARGLTKRRSAGQGHLWAAMGLDHVPCKMGCKFCSFAMPWTAITSDTQLDPAQIEAQAIRFLEAGADYLVLRTSERYPLERLLELGRRLAPRVHPKGWLVANTGSQSADGWRQLHSAGFDGIYKTIRLREGIDTPFDRQQRLENILAANAAGLEIYALVEPVGPEHTADELLEAIITLRDLVRPVLVGAMARVPVPGSPLERFGRVEEIYLADLTAIVVLSLLPALDQCRVVCSHPASPSLVQAGANALVVEMGAIPRDTSFAKTEWGGLTTDDVWRLLASVGYCSIGDRQPEMSRPSGNPFGRQTNGGL